MCSAAIFRSKGSLLSGLVGKCLCIKLLWMYMYVILYSVIFKLVLKYKLLNMFGVKKSNAYSANVGTSLTSAKTLFVLYVFLCGR